MSIHDELTVRREQVVTLSQRLTENARQRRTIKAEIDRLQTQLDKIGCEQDGIAIEIAWREGAIEALEKVQE